MNKTETIEDYKVNYKKHPFSKSIKITLKKEREILFLYVSKSIIHFYLLFIVSPIPKSKNITCKIIAQYFRISKEQFY